jgi:hypothetical protein
MGLIQHDDALGAETIPGLLVTELTTAHGQDARSLQLMADNAAQRELIAALQDRNAALARQVAELRADLATATGANATPQPGCQIVEVPVPGGKLLVEIETEGGDDGIDLLNIFVGGKWIDVQNLHAATDLDVLRESVAGVLA